ncbi:MAG: 4-phosphoerythronate dehydrogenase [Muribaculaceae bacterium]|nr:4-phosphoerythronate dehydrogenase [Muribaculaceae bacterium]
MKIVVDSGIPFIENRFDKDVEIVSIPGSEISRKTVEDADALIVRTRTKCNSGLLGDTNVKVIATATIGTDHIDIPWCERNGIKVFSAPGCNAPGVAQYVFSSLFKTGFDPRVHTLGIIGFGNVGSTIGEWAKEMGIKILINDPPRQKRGECDVTYTDLAELLKNSDAVTVHVPLTSDGENPTMNLLGDKDFKLMKPGSVIINSSRGGVIDEKALLPFLVSGKLKAIIDVWEKEPVISRDLLNLASIATPHIAGYSYEGKKRGTRMALEAVANALGIEPDFNGLDSTPPSEIKISRGLIESSYNPIEDSIRLKNNPHDFELLRNTYNYRHEPLFSKS